MSIISWKFHENLKKFHSPHFANTNPLWSQIGGLIHVEQLFSDDYPIIISILLGRFMYIPPLPQSFLQTSPNILLFHKYSIPLYSTDIPFTSNH